MPRWIAPGPRGSVYLFLPDTLLLLTLVGYGTLLDSFITFGPVPVAAHRPLGPSGGQFPCGQFLAFWTRALLAFSPPVWVWAHEGWALAPLPCFRSPMTCCRLRWPAVEHHCQIGENGVTWPVGLLGQRHISHSWQPGENFDYHDSTHRHQYFLEKKYRHPEPFSILIPKQNVFSYPKNVIFTL